MRLIHNTRENYDYTRGYSDGFKEGYNKALEDYLIKQQEQFKSQTVIVVKGELE